MTFSLVGRCARTGQFGAAAATSSLAVGARVHAVAPGIGAVLTQHRTDPRLGPRGIGLLRSGCTAQQTVAALVASTPDHKWRQLAAIDAAGRTAHFHGANVKPESGAAHRADVVAIGNILSSAAVPDAMADAFAAAPGLPLAERLLRGLEAGEAAGGEHGDVRSASLLVFGAHDFALVDLRADGHAAPIPALRALWDEYAPLVEAYVVRVLDPDNARVL
ncbi:DUF1028 domain-containing protein [Falsiroseomonas sp. CW058]|uniref:DUF1028 domain-containing protein n=1 Tax=Falsiroseomonas sp. CW058 TaxID=3388664 RepID=UPI003D31D943